MEKLILRYNYLLEQTSTKFVRYNHDSIDWNDRMIAIVGARGVGKTTLLLQHIKMHLPKQETIYVSADDMYFTNHGLLDFAEEFHRSGGRYLYIDEVHKYAGWSKEIKLIYDYLPNLNIALTGSSILDIFKGTDDLSRRVLLYKMYGMSFREYLNMRHKLNLPAYSLEAILNHEVKAEGVEFPLAAFKEYLRNGYYPFAERGNYYERLLQTVHTTLETDIPLYANMNATTSVKLKQLMDIIAQSVPFKPNYSSLSKLMGIDRKTLADYLTYMTKAGMLLQLKDNAGSISSLGKVEKIYLNNTNLAYLLGNEKANTGNIRETFFLSQTSAVSRVTSSAKADFTIGEYTFEIGGRKKGNSQIEGIDNAFVVKDDIEYGFMNTIPLWHFGFLY